MAIVDSGINAISTEHLRKILSELGVSVEPTAYARLVARKFKYFRNLEDWDHHLLQCDLSIGTRLHGNLLALTNERPAVVITHDARTTDICEYLRIPHIDIAEIHDLNIRSICDSVDFAEFQSNFPALYDRYADFLSENRLKHRLKG